MSVPWAGIAPDPAARRPPQRFDGSRPSAYPGAGWSIYDRIVRAAQAREISLDLTLTGPAPRWAAGRDAPGGPFRTAWKPSARAFGAFVAAVGARYSGTYTPAGAASPLPRVSFWSIWNEPNYGPNLAPQAVDFSTVEVAPALYRGLLDAAWAALHRTGHGDDTILIGELAPRGITTGDNPGNFSGMVPLRFIRALYCVDASYRPLRGQAAARRACPAKAAGTQSFPGEHPALFHASGVSVHPYPQGQVPPDVATPGEPDYVELASLPNLERTLDEVQHVYGSATRFAIYSTEFGYHTNPPETIARAVAPALAAYYLNWSEYISWLDPRVRSYDQYLLIDPSSASALGGFATGLEFASGIPKATYQAYRLPIYMPVTAGHRGQQLLVWGCLRPVHHLSGGAHQSVRIEYSAGSGGAFKTIRMVAITNPHGYFEVPQVLPGSGLLRLAWSYPDGTTIHSRTVAVTIR